MRSVTLALVLVGVGCAPIQKPFVLGPPSSALDGKTFEVTLKSGKSQHQDKLIFGIGQFQCVSSADDNFTPAAYSTERMGTSTTFQSQTRSATDGTYNWSGTVSRDRIEGTREWIDKQGKVTRYSFSGQIVSSQSQLATRP